MIVLVVVRVSPLVTIVKGNGMGSRSKLSRGWTRVIESLMEGIGRL